MSLNYNQWLNGQAKTRGAKQLFNVQFCKVFFENGCMHRLLCIS